ncbi:IS256 family transposase [Enorma burkinafasonensis]|uniref:IS256 family transposase n=1 Tax=Enorma burkinafasonensis TaxID=2590867 RepID=UPI0011A0A672|nr:IS256 family transposase [Enorma burkinafasonensis]
MNSIPESAILPPALPRFEDGFINMQELLRSLAESVVNEIMPAEADQLCDATGNSGNGYRERPLVTCVGTLTLRIPKLRVGSFFPGDAIERYQRVDRAIVAAVSEMHATGTSTRKVQKAAAAMGVERLSKDQVSAICEHLDAEVEELVSRPLGALGMPCLWVDATYVKCRRDRRVASTAVVTAIGCDEGGWRRVLGVSVVDTEGYDSWVGFLRRIRARGVTGVQLVTSDAHEGLRRAIEEVFQGSAWQRCVVHLMRDCARAAPVSRGRVRRVCKMVAPVFRLKEAGAVRAAYHLAVDMLEGCCPEAARILGGAEPDALAHLDFPPGHWKRLRTNNVQERANREIKRRARVVQAFPSTASLERLAGAVMCDQDEARSDARYFPAGAMSELYEEQGAAEAASPERRDEWLSVAKKAIEASLELADELEAA